MNLCFTSGKQTYLLVLNSRFVWMRLDENGFGNVILSLNSHLVLSHNLSLGAKGGGAQRR